MYRFSGSCFLTSDKHIWIAPMVSTELSGAKWHSILTSSRQLAHIPVIQMRKIETQRSEATCPKSQWKAQSRNSVPISRLQLRTFSLYHSGLYSALRASSLGQGCTGWEIRCHMTTYVKTWDHICRDSCIGEEAVCRRNSMEEINSASLESRLEEFS